MSMEREEYEKHYSPDGERIEYLMEHPEENRMEEEKNTSWEERAVGKNIHSVYVLCMACHTWGINEPLDKKCGNCGNEDDSYTYYDSETITEIIRQEREALLREIIDLSDKIESQYPTEFNEWRAFKGFRNALRDIINTK